jgi:uncharacterized protein YjiS (DUF1127 family)
MTSTTHVLPAGASGASVIGQRLMAMAKGLWTAYWRKRSERATIVLLHSLGDRVLNDIGIDRSEIESVVRTRSRGRLQRFDSA